MRLIKILAVSAAIVAPAAAFAQSYYMREQIPVAKTGTPTPLPTQPADPDPTPTPAPAPTPLTYSWNTSTWSDWTHTCSTSATRTRSVTCVSSAGQTVDDAMCSSTKPLATEPLPTDQRDCGGQVAYGSFQQGLTGAWSAIGTPDSAGKSYPPIFQPTGICTTCVMFPKQNNGSGTGTAIVSQTVRTVPGVRYRVRFWCYGSDTPKAFWNGTTVANATCGAGNSWKENNNSGIVVGTGSDTVSFRTSGTSGTSYIDSVSLEPVL